MKRIFIPAQTPDDWQQFLADPDKHWRTGYSARTLAYCWHAADGFPAEIRTLLQSADYQPLRKTKPLVILPEYTVQMPGRGFPSQNDIFVLAKAGDGTLISMVVEGKVNESFGDTIGKWKVSGKKPEGRQRRLAELCRILGISEIPETIYYQLVHRTAAAVITAAEYSAVCAVMVVHSFSPEHAHWQAFSDFVSLYGQTPGREKLLELPIPGRVRLFIGWAHGDEQFLRV